MRRTVCGMRPLHRAYLGAHVRRDQLCEHCARNGSDDAPRYDYVRHRVRTGAVSAERADIMLDPILGVGDYNHLSVRAAVSDHARSPARPVVRKVESRMLFR